MYYNYRTYYLHSPNQSDISNEVSIEASVKDFLTKSDERASYAFIQYSNFWGIGLRFVEIDYWNISQFKNEYPDVEMYTYDLLTNNLESIISKNIKIVNQDYKLQQIEKDFL